MLNIMADEHGADFYMPEMKLCGDNGVMIAWLGLLINKYSGPLEMGDTGIIQRFRTDEVDIPWVSNKKSYLKLSDGLIAKGAESNIVDGQYLNKSAILKNRIPKNYRIPEIDNKIRKSRTKLEAKLLSDVKRGGVITPLLYNVDLDDKIIAMEKIDGKMVKDIITMESEDLATRIGQDISKIHNQNIIHGDITTSNMLVDSKGDLVFLDFGLGRYSDLLEDKAVDLLVLKKSLQSIDQKIASHIFDLVLDGYNNDDIVKKIKEIELRGRYTH